MNGLKRKIAKTTLAVRSEHQNVIDVRKARLAAINQIDRRQNEIGPLATRYALNGLSNVGLKSDAWMNRGPSLVAIGRFRDQIERKCTEVRTDRRKDCRNADRIGAADRDLIVVRLRARLDPWDHSEIQDSETHAGTKDTPVSQLEFQDHSARRLAVIIRTMPRLDPCRVSESFLICWMPTMTAV